MNDPDTCAHGRQLFAKCIFCGGVAKKPPERGAKVAGQRQQDAVSPTGIPLVERPARDAGEMGRRGDLASGQRRNALAKEAVRAANAELLEKHKALLAASLAGGPTEADLVVPLAERAHEGVISPLGAPVAMEQRSEYSSAIVKASEPTPEELAAEVERLHKGDTVPARPAGKVASGSLVFVEGVIHFCVDLRIGAAELAAWSPDRIARFFQGVCQAIKAKEG